MSTANVIELQNQMGKLQKQIASIQMDGTLKQVAAVQLQKNSAKQHQNWTKPCVLCKSTDCLLCASCFQFCSKSPIGVHTFKDCKRRNPDTQPKAGTKYEGLSLALLHFVSPEWQQTCCTICTVTCCPQVSDTELSTHWCA